MAVSDPENPYKARDEALLFLGFSSYDAYLRSDLWRTIRKRAIAKKGKCRRCLRTNGMGAGLQVHHTEYSIKTLTGADTSALEVVCQRCHVKAEQPGRKRKSAKDRLNGANAYIASKPSISERCWVWYDRNKRHLPHLTKPEEVRALIDTYRQNATSPDGIRCLICAESNSNLLVRVTSANHPCCSRHEWAEIRAAARALAVDLTAD